VCRSLARSSPNDVFAPARRRTSTSDRAQITLSITPARSLTLLLSEYRVVAAGGYYDRKKSAGRCYQHHRAPYDTDKPRERFKDIPLQNYSLSGLIDAAMSGECQVRLQQQQQQQQLRLHRDRLSFEVPSAALAGPPWLAACYRDGSSLPGPSTVPPGSADYWLRRRVDHQQTDAGAPASCYFNRPHGKSPHHTAFASSPNSCAVTASSSRVPEYIYFICNSPMQVVTTIKT